MTLRIRRAAAHHREQVAIWRRLAERCISAGADLLAREAAELAVLHLRRALLLESLPREIDRAA